MIEGRCLCGAVTIRATPSGPLTACHCGMCRRWSGGVQAGFASPADRTEVSGPVRTYASSSFAERAWCGTCGSSLWLRDTDGPFELVPGLFPDARDWPLDHENYVDRAHAALRLPGDHRRLTAADYERDNPFVEGNLP